MNDPRTTATIYIDRQRILRAQIDALLVDLDRHAARFAMGALPNQGDVDRIDGVGQAIETARDRLIRERL